MSINMTTEALKPLCKKWATEKVQAWGRAADQRMTVEWLSTRLRRRPVELSGAEARVIEEAVEDMDERPRLVLHAHYMVRPDIGKQTSSDCGISEAQYWQELNCAYAFIAGSMSVSGALEKASAALSKRINGR